MKAKRFLAILLCILLVGSVFPAGLSAEEMVVDTEIAAEEAVQAQEATMPETEAAAESMEAEEPQTPPEEIPEPPVSEAPATEAPVTEAPVTEAPVTEAPVTEAPVTEQVVTESVATEAPVTEPVVTEKVETEQAAGEEAAFGDVPDTDPEENPVTEKSYPAFNQSMTVDGVTVTVSAQEGTFPEGAMLSVVSVPTSQVESDIEKERDEEQNVVVSYTFDIKVLDKDGTELQPADDKPVQVSFRTAEVADSNLETNVYHVPEEGEVETLDVDVSGSTAITETDGFSLYTVEFTYNNLEYILQGGSRVPLQEILSVVGLVGEATGAQVSNAELFSVSNETGEWVVTSHKPFSSEEWLRVTIDERDYQIMVTDETQESDFEVHNGVIFKYLGSGGDVLIPDKIGGDPIYSIDEYAFYNCTSVTSVTIPDGVTSINEDAFLNCTGLKTVTFGSDSDLFSIKDSAFRDCSSLKSINLPTNYLHDIGPEAFRGCGSLESIEIPAAVEEIKSNTFEKCSALSNVSFGEGIKLTSIGVNAFSDCKKLQSIDIPDKVTSIGESAFEGCGSLENVIFGEKSELTSIGQMAFYDCGSLKSVTIPASVKSIGNAAFKLGGFETVTFGVGSELTSIKSETFSFCNKLKRIEIPAGVLVIEGSAFYGCSSLESVTIPAGVTNIDGFAFGLCPNLKDIYYLGTEKSWNDMQRVSDWDSETPDKTIHIPVALTATVIPDNSGTIEVNTETVCPVAGKVWSKTDITLKAKAANDMTFSCWTSDDEEISFSDASSAETTFEMPGKDVTVKANYKAKPKLTITANPQEYTYNGQIQGEGDTAYNDAEIIKKKVSIEGLADGDVITKIILDGQCTNVNENDKKITPSDAAVKNNNNEDVTSKYVISYKEGTLTVSPAKATITVDNASKVKGEKDPAFTGKVEGLVKDSDLGKISYSRTNTDEDSGTYTGVLTAGYTPNDNYTVTVKNGDFTIKEVFTLKWVDDNGSELQIKTYIEGEQPPAYDGKDPVKAATAQYSYTFSGWDSGTVSGTVTTFKPVFTETVNKYKVTFVDEDGKTVLKEAAEYDYGTTADKIEKPKDPTKAADAKNTYTFSGWDPKIAEVTGDVTYKATYTSTPVPTPTKQGTLTFDLGGGTLDGKTGKITIKANVGDIIKLPGAPTKEGFTFKFWKGSEYAAGAEYKVEGDHAFTAEWEENKFTVKFDVNGHGTAPASQIVKEGMKAIKPNDPSESGYTFGGWYKEKECTNVFDFNTAITEDITLYAKWTKKDNGGSSSGGSSTPSAATTAVKTGDDTPISTWLLILGGSALVIAALLLIRKRRKI